MVPRTSPVAPTAHSLLFHHRPYAFVLPKITLPPLYHHASPPLSVNLERGRPPTTPSRPLRPLEIATGPIAKWSIGLKNWSKAD